MSNDFFTLLTAVGKNKLAAASTGGAPLKLTHMAVGDGDNGGYYTPSEAQAALKHEVWRAPLNNLSTDPQNPNWIIAELVIPDEVGGFTIREVGVFDADGALIAVGKFPESYKPVLADGANKQLYVRLIMEVSNAAAVTLQVDPSVVLATRATVDQRIAEELAKLDGKPSVRAATTAAIVLAGLQTVDGVALQAGDRVLVKNQANGADNGIYVAGAGNWTRAADANASMEVTPGLFVAVEQGAVNGGAIWQLTTPSPIVLGTSALAFTLLAGNTGVAAGTYRSVTVNARGQVVGGCNPGTPPQFDRSAAPATTEFVRQAIGNYQKTVQLSGVAVLAQADLGSFVTCTGTGGYAITLPSPQGGASDVGGGQFLIWNNTTGMVTVKTSAGVFYGPAGGSGLASRDIPQNGVLQLVSDSYNWVIVSASERTPVSTKENGYRLLPAYPGDPDPLILQWGIWSGGTGNNDKINLAIPFPNGFLQGVATDAGGGIHSVGLIGGDKNTITLCGGTFNGSATTYTTTAYRFFVIGH
ncbi:phage tail protein [Chromobacterium sp. ASV23]|uniref:phage tail protein n=1 Tax=Chromobacterium sp. ASV23 TaxID=2795110 RepID=UPI0018EA5171|nr:phage tail protein [Chromobacterium sp. ASV23]